MLFLLKQVPQGIPRLENKSSDLVTSALASCKAVTSATLPWIVAKIQVRIQHPFAFYPKETGASGSICCESHHAAEECRFRGVHT